jgi:hypothetical protein
MQLAKCNHQGFKRTKELQVMKSYDLIDSMAFSHRPNDGISVGVAVIAGVAYLSVGFVREGDFFNRKLARNILAQRVVSTIEENSNVKFVAVVEHLSDKVDARGVIRELRKNFKPDPMCNDNTFSVERKLTNPFGSVGTIVREKMTRDEQWRKITGMFKDAVQAASVQKVTS